MVGKTYKLQIDKQDGGTVLKSASKATPSECAEYCLSETSQSCVGFNYNEPNSMSLLTCHLLSSHGTVTNLKGNMFATVKS